MNAIVPEMHVEEDMTAFIADPMSAFRAHVQAVTGISIGPAKESMIRQRLGKPLSQTDFSTVEQYLRAMLTNPGLQRELAAAVDLMTTNTTYFFREQAHFDFLAGTIVPDIAEDHGPGRQFRLNVWSAASSEGAEAYTTAMVLSELQTLHTGMDYAIIGTDISPRMVKLARNGIYKVNQTDRIPGFLRRKYLMTGVHGDMRGKVRFCPELRRRVKFACMNLKQDRYPISPNVDVAFLRNVLIYFEPDDQQLVIARVVSRIRKGGHLFVGHSESMIVDHPGMEQIAPSIFRKI
ncbi:chemotaxis protein CheR [Donghicola sp. C2-DW-16]|uniref:Chemotaxis protein methyltransferase n=1 Tax=Donghicola mangrovi TaxID=2729614 RepID=A0ABX2PHE8_9RHOB|nr:CheR family methyltransferase [Donghicola mangrovi]NVO28900.1 chemotaxis protein CheR [Donghicola mangrovi]